MGWSAKREPPLCKGRCLPKADGGVVNPPPLRGAPFTQGGLYRCDIRREDKLEFETPINMGVPIGTPCIYALLQSEPTESGRSVRPRTIRSPELSAATRRLAAAAVVVAAAVAAPVVAAAIATAAEGAATTAVAEEQYQNDDPPPVVIQTAADTVIVAHMITSASFR